MDAELAKFWRLDARVALVTGAGSGIGEATAKLLAAAGAKVALVSQTADELAEVAGRIRTQGGEALALPADVSSEVEMQHVVDEILNKWKRLDIVVANAGINGTWAPLEELTLDEWNQTLAVNLTGSFLTLKLTVPHLKQRGGAVVFNASINGTRVFSNSGATAYATSKAGQVALAKMTALELAPQRVRVNVICPGSIATPIHDKTEARHLEEVEPPVEYPEGTVPLTHGRPGEADDVARLIHFLVSDAARHITGTEMWIDGGESLLMG